MAQREKGLARANIQAKGLPTAMTFQTSPTFARYPTPCLVL